VKTEKMKKDFAITWMIVMAIAVLFSILMLPPVMAADENVTGRIAFTSNRDGNNEIYLMIGANITRLTYNISNDINPEWHPKGNKIAFSSDRDGDFEIYVMDADGTNVTQLTDNTVADGCQCWSPNGSKIAFCSDRDGDYRDIRDGCKWNK
jgi:Tol biopolymer transport system component